ncbi:hypothetical protein BG004_002024 [Podila humilis]|nr:hypothetical protein BG004_002024 [Podila humilis]
MSAPDSGLSYWKPRFKYTTKGPMGGYYKNETVFAYGIFQPGHFSHFLYDGILPLYSTMKRFHGTNSSWLLRQATYVGENTMQQAVWEMDAITSGKELVLNAFEVVSSFQVLPPKSHPICFERAVIGLGSQCGFGYCATNTPVEVYKAYRDQIQEFYFATPTQWTSFHNNERRKHLAAKFSPSMCVEKARYYNFQHPSSGLEIEGEPQIRQGVRNPDSVVVDPSAAVATFPNASPSISPIVAIIERHGSRSVLNLDKVIERTVAQGFRVKVMTYDQGCGIPQVAYMMRDVNILISTHGNALGGSLWMPDKPWPLIISIETTKHHETWFMTTTTVLAQRFTIHCCGPQFSGSLDYESTCPFIRDVGLARVSLKGLNWQLDPEKEEQELELLTGAEYPLEMLDKYGGDKLHPFLSTYWKNLPRYADVDRLAGLLEKVWREIPQDADKSFLQICQEGRCCGPGCDGVMARNIVGPWRAYGQQLDSAHWGEHLAEGGWDGNGNNGNWNEASRSAQELKSWVV